MGATDGGSVGTNPQNIPVGLEPLSGYAGAGRVDSMGHEETGSGALPTFTYLVSCQAVQRLEISRSVGIVDRLGEGRLGYRGG
jgi:hypothetical protein